CSLVVTQEHFERHSQRLIPEVSEENGTTILTNGTIFSAGGLYDRSFGPYREAIPEQKIKLFSGPTVHSVSATTANIEWRTNLPTQARFSWGESTEMENVVDFGANGFASYSLTDLKPNTTYYLKLDSLRIPSLVDIVADAVDLDGEMISFTTLAADPEPVTYYVSPDGDDSNSGLGWDDAFRSIQRGANSVGVGDTVIIGEGTYYERVRIRATGTKERPILFRAAPGARVMMDGLEKNLNQALVVAKKQYLHFDGFQFRQYSFGPSSTSNWRPLMGSDFNLSESEHITITRCLHDGRGGTSSSRAIITYRVDDLLVRNSVATNKMSNAYYFSDSTNIRVENSVIARPMIAGYLARRIHGFVLTKSIFTDSLKKKAELNIALFNADGAGSGLEMPDNVFQLREFPPHERIMMGSQTATSWSAITNPLFVDPVFAGAVALMEAGVTSSFWPDRLMHGDVVYDFQIFVATNPDVVAAGIGLEPDQFVNGQPK
ncbi:MAG: hypothetical protein ACNA8W_24985, partial [Bradymonadaceae bacterium]